MSDSIRFDREPRDLDHSAAERYMHAPFAVDYGDHDYEPLLPPVAYPWGRTIGRREDGRFVAMPRMLAAVAELPTDVFSGVFERLWSEASESERVGWSANTLARWGLDRALRYLDRGGYYAASQALDNWACECAGFAERE